MRTNKVNLIAGTRGTGKTDFVKNLIASMRSIFAKQLVVDTFDSETWHNLQTFSNPQNEAIKVPILSIEKMVRWKNGIARIFSSDTASMMTEIETSLTNCHLVFEDATKYIGSRLTPEMKMFVLDSKQKNLDITFIFHSLSSIPPDLVRVADTLTLFKTNEGDVSKDKYPFPAIPQMMKQLRDSKNRYESITILLN